MHKPHIDTQNKDILNIYHIKHTCKCIRTNTKTHNLRFHHRYLFLAPSSFILLPFRRSHSSSLHFSLPPLLCCSLPTFPVFQQTFRSFACPSPASPPALLPTDLTCCLSLFWCCPCPKATCASTSRHYQASKQRNEKQGSKPTTNWSLALGSIATAGWTLSWQSTPPQKVPFKDFQCLFRTAWSFFGVNF